MYYMKVAKGIWDVAGEPEQAQFLALLAQNASNRNTNNHYSVALQNRITKYYVFMDSCLALVDHFNLLAYIPNTKPTIKPLVLLVLV